MRRNRLSEAAAAGAPSAIPVLTDAVADADAEAEADLPVASALETQRAAESGVAAPVPQSDQGAPLSSAADVPILTEIVEDFDPISILGEPTAVAGAAQWPDFDDGAIATREAPQVVGDATTFATALPEAIAEVVPDAMLAGEAAPGEVDPDAARWNALAEDVRMQVLQRIDIFTDTGLQKQLVARLQPIVDRASADLVATINQQVGHILRGYVAEAIEREIEKWRHDGAS